MTNKWLWGLDVIVMQLLSSFLAAEENIQTHESCQATSPPVVWPGTEVGVHKDDLVPAVLVDGC